MLTEQGCRGRRDRLWQALPGECDAVLVASPEHMTYLCGYWPSSFTFRTNEGGAALVLTRDHATLIGDNLLRPFLDEAFVDEVVAPVWYEGKRSAEPRRSLLARTMAAELARLNPRCFGLEPASLPCGVVDVAGFGITLDLGPTLVQLRRTKDPDEIATLRTAIDAAERGFAAAAGAIGEGRTELDVFHAAEAACRQAVDAPVAVYGDFACGARAKGPDTLPRTTRLKRGDLLILDFSVIVQGYRGDYANTHCVGTPSARQQEVFDACLVALQASEAMLTAGTPCRDIDQAARASLRRSGFPADRPGHMGHGLGLGHPEAPFFVAESDETLQAGDVVTLEPSLFPDDIEGGVRIEHNYLITESGAERLSRHRLGL